MEAIKQNEIEITQIAQNKQILTPRMIFIGALGVTVFYMVWGIAKIVF